MVKQVIILIFILAHGSGLLANDNYSGLFSYDAEKVAEEFSDLNNLEAFLNTNPDADELLITSKFPDLSYLFHEEKIYPANLHGIAAPGNFPSFWFSFALSAVGTYFIYGVAAGPISVAIVYFSTSKDKKETKKAIWGCISGTLIGAGIKYAVVNFM